MVRTVRSVLGALMPNSPMFTKELRVSSRRRRYYMLRIAYLGLLTAFVVLVWLTFTQGGSGETFTISRMSEAGKKIIGSIMWFQLIASNLVAILLLSTSISDEVHHGTLGVLMTTPMRPFQIVAGKLFSRLMQLLMLIAISFPLLAIVRVFGGVPWAYVLAGLGVTLTSCIFAGAVTMIFSILFRQAYVSILASIGALVGFYTVISLVLLLTCVGAVLILFVNPYAAMYWFWVLLMDPSQGSQWGMVIIAPLHCAVMLGLSGLVLWMCSRLVRKVAMRQAVGGGGVVAPTATGAYVPMPTGAVGMPPPPPGALGPPRAFNSFVAMPAGTPPPAAIELPAETETPATVEKPQPAAADPAAALARLAAQIVPQAPQPQPAPVEQQPPASAAGYLDSPLRKEGVVAEQATGAPERPEPEAPTTPIRTIDGSPILWRELKRPLLKDPTVRNVLLIVGGILLLMLYVFMGALGELKSGGVQAFFLILYLVPAVFCTIVLASATITTEKETRCWPLLLTTTLPDSHILAAKVAGVLRRTWMLWVPALLHTIVFTLFLVLRPVALLHVTMLAAGTLAFTLGLGMYFSTRLRRTTAALVVTFAIVAAVWGLLPLTVKLATVVLGEFDNPWVDYLYGLSPLVQSVVLSFGNVTRGDFGHAADHARYVWFVHDVSAGVTTLRMLLYSGAFAGIGMWLIWRARGRFRKDVF